MKRIAIVILFLSMTLGFILAGVNVKKDSMNIDIKLKNIEALGAGEDGSGLSCSIVGTVCIEVAPDGSLIFHQGLSLGDS